MLKYKNKFLLISIGILALLLMSNLPVQAAPQTADRLMRSKLRIGGADILMGDTSFDADDAQLLVDVDGTTLQPQIADLIFPKGIDFDLEDSQMLSMGMDLSQFSSELFINGSMGSGTEHEESSCTDPTETTALSFGTESAYNLVTLAADSSDVYSGFYYDMEFFYDVDNDGVEDDSELDYLPDFNEDCYFYITAKGDWSNVSTTAGDNVMEIDMYFTTAGADLELESHITADADGNTGWTNFDDGSADNKATFLYANADDQFVAFFWDLSTLDVYDEDDYSSIKGLDKIRIKNTGWGDSATSALTIYNIAAIKKADVWNYGTDKRPAMTPSGCLNVDNDFIPSLTASVETDGGMYLFDDIDLPVTTVTESSDVTSAYSNLINTDEAVADGDKLPLRWRKLKVESDQTGTNKEDDFNLELLPTTYSFSQVRNHPDGGVEIKEKFTFDLTGMDDIQTAASLMTWDTSTDKMYIQDYLTYSKMASDIYDSNDPAELVCSAFEGAFSTYDAVDDLKSSWAAETDFSYIQYVLVKQPSTTTGDILVFERSIRYDADAIPDDTPVAGGSPIAIARSNSFLIVCGLGLVGVVVALLMRKRKRRG